MRSRSYTRHITDLNPSMIPVALNESSSTAATNIMDPVPDVNVIVNDNQIILQSENETNISRLVLSRELIYLI